MAQGQAAEAGTRPEGRRSPRVEGEHRRCAEDLDDGDQRAAPRLAEERRHQHRRDHGPVAHDLPRRGSAAGQGRGVPHRRRRNRAHELRPQPAPRRRLRVQDEAEHRARSSRAGGRAGDADDRSPRQRARRGRAEHRAAAERRGDSRPASRRHRRRAREGHHGQDGDPRIQAGRGGPGVQGRSAEAVQRHAARRDGDPAGVGRQHPRRRPDVLRRPQARAGHRPGPARREAGARREQPAGGPFRAEVRRRGEVRQAVGREPRPLPRDHPRQQSRLGPQARRAHHGSGADQRRIHGRERERPVADAAVRRAPRFADQPGRARRRSDARRGLDSRRRGVVDR